MLHKILSNAAMRLIVVKGNMSLSHLEKSSRNPYGENEALLKKIIKSNKNTEFGKSHNFGEIKSLEDFRKNVPISVYEDYAPFIERIKNGEENILTTSKILGYSRTSGSSGVPKYIPATSASIKAYVKYTWTRALALAVKELEKNGKKFKPGRGVFLSPATNEKLPNGLPCSNIAEIGAMRYGFLYPFILTIPTKNLFDVHDGDYIYNIYRFALMDEDTTFIFSVFYSINVSQLAYLKEHWQVIVNDIEKGTIDDSIEMKPELKKLLLKRIKPMPERGAYLRKQFEQGFDETLLKRLWPNLTMISAIGNASFKASTDYVRSVAGDTPFDFSIYGASEGLVAACYALENTDMQLLTDSCFYEFIPANSNGEEVLTLNQLEKGKQYEILITTQAGLYRYHLKDVIEVKDFRNRTPLISFVYRKGQLFNVAGEKFSEEDARTTIEMFNEAHGTHIDNWFFYQDDSVMPGRYALVVETDEKIDWEASIDELEEIMGKCNKRYVGQREKAFISRMVVRKQKAGTHAEWGQRLIAQGASIAQIKPVHFIDNDAKREFFLSRIE